MRNVYSLLGFALLLPGVAVNGGAQSQQRATSDVAAITDLMQRKEYRHAIDSLEKLVSSREWRDPEIYIMLSTCRLYVHEPQEAVAVCERALKACPDVPKLEKFYVSMLRAALTSKERAAKLMEKHREKPNSLIYTVGLAEALLAGDPSSPEIEPLLSSAAKSLPEDAETHYLYGRWACLNDRQDLAVRELTKALSLTTDNIEAEMQIYLYLAIAYDHLGQASNADAAFRASMARNERLSQPQPGPAMEYVGFLERQEHESEAQNLVLRILKFAPSFGAAHLARARFLGREERVQEALAEGELALRYAGTDKEELRAAHAFLARTCGVLGRVEEAQSHRKWIESH